MISPFVSAMLSWSEAFESGRIKDPYLADGTLAPDERFAVRIGALRRATLALSPEPRVETAGPAANLVATDRPLVFVLDSGVEIWSSEEDLNRLAPLVGLGVAWAPTRPDPDGGSSRQAAVVPTLVYGRHPNGEELRALFPECIKVAVAWRATQPGGVAAWRSEFREKVDHTW